MEIGKNYTSLQGIDPVYAPKARDAFQKALSIAPRREDAHINLVMWYLSARDFANAKKELDELLALNDKVGPFWWYAAAYEAAVNNPSGVERALAKAESQRPISYDWHNVRDLSFFAATFERNKNMPQAVKYYGLIAVENATSAPDLALQALERVFSLSAGSGLGGQALRIKAEVLAASADSQKPQIEALARKYGL